MEMEVVMPMVPPSMDFNFDSTCSSPYMTAPSSPQRFGTNFLSAPTSPSSSSSSSSNRVFNVDETNNTQRHDEEDDDFEFNFSGNLEKTSLSADELFDGGKIKPLKPPIVDSASTDLCLRGRKQKVSSLSPSSSSSSSFVPRKGSRSLSPMRVSDIIYEEHDQDHDITNSSSSSQTVRIISSSSSSSSSTNNSTRRSSSYGSSFLSAISFSRTNRKWKLKDLLLFRSASKGRPICTTKYAVLSKKEPATDDVKNSSFRSTNNLLFYY